MNLKKTILTIIALLLSSSFSAQAESCKDRIQSQVRSGMRAEPLFSTGTLDTIYNSEEKRIGVGRFIEELPKSYDKIFFENKDFSSEMIQQRAEESERFWSSDFQDIEKENLVRHFKEYSFDYISYRDLTLQTAKVWKQLLSCNNNDVNLLRKNYFMGNPCGAQSPENDSAVKAITELNVNYANFIKSSNLIQSSQLSQASRLMREMAEERGLIVNFTLPHQHPLLVQIQMQNWSVVVNSANERRREDLMPFYESKFSDEESVPRGQATSEYAAIKAWRKAMNNSAIIIAGNRDLDSRSLANGTACSQFGLWPAMNRSLYVFMKYGSYNQMESTIIYNLGSLMIDYVEKACGTMPNDPFSYENGIYSRFSLAHLYEMKRLFARYWDQKVNQPYALAMKQSGVTPYQNLICTE